MNLRRNRIKLFSRLLEDYKNMQTYVLKVKNGYDEVNAALAHCSSIRVNAETIRFTAQLEKLQDDFSRENMQVRSQHNALEVRCCKLIDVL